MTPEEVSLLEEGDYVEDCRGRTLKVVSYSVEYYTNVGKFYQFCYNNLPEKLADFICDIQETVYRFLKKEIIFDKELTFEDGSSDSARNCCSYIGKTNE